MNDIVSASAGEPGFWLMMLKSIGMLCIVIALLVGVLFIIRQLSEKRSGRINKSLINLLASFHIAPKEKLMLIDVMGKKILIGVTQQSINCLAILDGDLVIDAATETSMEKPGGSFESLLQKFSHSSKPSPAEDLSDVKK